MPLYPQPEEDVGRRCSEATAVAVPVAACKMRNWEHQVHPSEERWHGVSVFVHWVSRLVCSACLRTCLKTQPSHCWQGTHRGGDTPQHSTAKLDDQRRSTVFPVIKWINIVWIKLLLLGWDETEEPPLWSSGQSAWLQIKRSRFDYWLYQIISEVVVLRRGPQAREYNWEATWKKN
jgi:hypothetical protein